ATLDDATPLGRRTGEQGKIFLNPPTWAIINGVGTPERQKTAWSQVEKTLLREHGPLLFLPAYDTPDARVGYLTRYAPGTRENGGVYTHAATWAILAACRMGRGSQAMDIYRKLAPPLKSLAPDDYAVEPYVLPGNINGPDSPLFGQGGWTWYTGSASWLRRIAQTHIIGVEPDWDGLRLTPCLPPDWDKVTMKRPYRGDILHITITNTEGLEGGEPTIFVDGKEMNAGDLLQASGKGLTRKVEIAFRTPVKA
ncbi:MAG: glycosyl transferase family 36, partial [Candidatus Sumerlaeia bacterium]|nr:glycosyl transferase family 36 [Candidatus Sumerlaeia bacterium]